MRIGAFGAVAVALGVALGGFGMGAMRHAPCEVGLTVGVHLRD